MVFIFNVCACKDCFGLYTKIVTLNEVDILSLLGKSSIHTPSHLTCAGPPRLHEWKMGISFRKGGFVCNKVYEL